MEVSPDKNNRDQIVANLENALREIQVSEIELRAIMDSLPAHAWCSRGDGYNIFCNQQWLDYSGFTQETALGWSYRDNIHPDDVGPYVKKWDEVSTMGTIIEAEARLRRFDGEYRWFLIRAVPVRDENGEIIRWFGTNTDIDERKKAEALLAGENKILEMVATGRPPWARVARLLGERSKSSFPISRLIRSGTNTVNWPAFTALEQVGRHRSWPLTEAFLVFLEFTGTNLAAHRTFICTLSRI